MNIYQVSPKIGEEELNNISDSIGAKWLSEGPWAEKFLDNLKSVSKAKNAVLAPNGTLGLYLALLSLDLPPGSEVLVPSFTFFGSASSIVFAGLKPVFVDVSLDDYSMDLNDLKSKVTSNTKAVMAVHIYGQIVNLSKLSLLCKELNLVLLEDAAQAMGVKYDGTHSGCVGDIGVISFFADKTITTGEGAVVFTKNDELYEKLKLLRNQGRPNSGTFIHSSLGMNFRMTDLQAAVGVAQLSKLKDIENQRLATYHIYLEYLFNSENIGFMKRDKNSTFIPFRFPITTNKKDLIMQKLTDARVQTRSFFYPMHLQPPLIKYHNNKVPCKNSESLYKSGIALPIHGDLTENDIKLICEIILQNSND